MIKRIKEHRRFIQIGFVVLLLNETSCTFSRRCHGLGKFRNNLIVKDGFYMQFRKSILFLSLIGLMFLSSSAFALQSGDFTYTESGGTVTITGYTGLAELL